MLASFISAHLGQQLLGPATTQSRMEAISTYLRIGENLGEEIHQLSPLSRDGFDPGVKGGTDGEAVGWIAGLELASGEVENLVTVGKHIQFSVEGLLESRAVEALADISQHTVDVSCLPQFPGNLLCGDNQS